MFGIVADALTLALTVLWPIFASYKALRTGDPALLAPWLMYWTVLSILLSVENFFAFVLEWVPFYSWFRLFIHLYLVLPGKQGNATQIYQEHVEPFLAHHEDEIDRFITDAHDKARQAGLKYVEIAIEYVKVNVLGFPPSPKTPPHSRTASQTYTQQLLSRFTLPSARPSAAAGPAGDLFNLVSQALSGAKTLYPGSADAQARNLSASGTLIPDNIRDPDERLSYIARQRDSLRVLLQAFDREAYNIGGTGTGTHSPQPPSPFVEQKTDLGGLSKSRSEVDFDKIYDEDEARRGGSSAQGPPRGVSQRTPSGGWMPWTWAGKPTNAPPPPPYPVDPAEEMERERSRREEPRRGKTSGFDPNLAY